MGTIFFFFGGGGRQKGKTYTVGANLRSLMNPVGGLDAMRHDGNERASPSKSGRQLTNAHRRRAATLRKTRKSKRPKSSTLTMELCIARSKSKSVQPCGSYSCYPNKKKEEVGKKKNQNTQMSTALQFKRMFKF